ncbi:hypothetical protein J6G99_00530 [bacterium]|nr:hypothetical protein [bacterium]
MLEKLYNPLLYYVDKEGNSVFRNYCLFAKDGCLYRETLSIEKAGIGLEYRLEQNRRLKIIYIVISFIVYFVLISHKINFLNIIECEFLWLFLVSIVRIFSAKKYSDYLIKTYGQYELVEFEPVLTSEKKANFARDFKLKIALFIITIGLLFTPSLILLGIIKHDIKSVNPHFKLDIVLSKLYTVFYPERPELYDIRAYAKYRIGDFEGSLKDYKTVLQYTGKNFKKADFTRLANLLYLEKKLYGSQEAIDVFNEFVTNKKLSVLQQSQVLWMKSIFSISNNIYEVVISDYDNLLASLNKNDYKNEFYISSDKAYMLYLMGYYEQALKLYSELIDFAELNGKKYRKELPRLYAERGFTKRKMGDYLSSDGDFIQSKIDMYEIGKYEPVLSTQGFIEDKF